MILIITVLVLLSIFLGLIVFQKSDSKPATEPQPNIKTHITRLTTECHYQADVGYVCPIVAKRTDNIEIKPYQLCSETIQRKTIASLHSQWKNEMRVADISGGIASGEVLYVMFKHDVFIGCGYIERKRFYPFISNLFVNPEYRKRGYAKDILNHCIEHIKTLGFTEARLWCSKDLVSFYNHLGWGTENIDNGTHVMVKKIIQK